MVAAAPANTTRPATVTGSPYSFKPFRGSSHSWALLQCSRQSASARVLDVGAGSGMIGAALLDRGLTDLTAVEVDEATLPQLRTLYRDVTGSLDALRGRQFDVVLLLDVLEHTTCAEDMLAAARDLLSREGRLLISVPNVAHLSVRLELATGRFEYRSHGILDRTHVQFFTLRRIEQMVQRVGGLDIACRDVSVVPVELLLPDWIWKNAAFQALSRVRVAAARLRPGLLAFQHLLVCRRSPSGNRGVRRNPLHGGCRAACS